MMQTQNEIKSAELNASAKPKKPKLNAVYFVVKSAKLYCYRVVNKQRSKLEKLLMNREIEYNYFISRDYTFFYIHYENGTQVSKLQRLNHKYDLSYRYFTNGNHKKKDANKES